MCGSMADPMYAHERLIEARRRAGYDTAADAARAMGVAEATYFAHENGSRGLSRSAIRYAKFFNVSLDWLLSSKKELGRKSVTEVAANQPSPQNGTSVTQANARVAGPVQYSVRIPAYGQAMTGPDGKFILNGGKIADVLAPPILQGVPDAYAVFISGESMEPRYFAGECVYVHPSLPVRRGDFVVVEIGADDEGEAPFAYVKRFISQDATRLRLEQFNPREVLEFPSSRVVRVHRIVGSGDGLL